ncbi:hypothetical protein LUZ60_011894 [Juncus effusus]|nr:hypothetical protein LUZ60_011894 [Juncus effusus]
MIHPPPSRPLTRSMSDFSHMVHKVPAGDTPYVRAKRVQLVEKDPNRAIVLFWTAINEGDRVDSALKDMAIVMKQQNRAEEAIEAIKSLRNRCSDQAQESLDNILLDLYKRCNRLDDQIALLKHKLRMIERGLAFNGKRTKTARSQGKKFQVTVEQEATRLLGNLGWALMQKNNYTEAEAAYRRALIIGPDNNKMCNLGICLMQQGRILEAKEVLMQVRAPNHSNPLRSDPLRGQDSHLKAFERAQEMLRDLEERKLMNWSFDAILGQSSAAIWQPHPCNDYIPSVPVGNEKFGIENLRPELNVGNEKFGNENLRPELNVDAQPFYCSNKGVKKSLDFGGTGNQNPGLSGKLKDFGNENRNPGLLGEIGNQNPGLLGKLKSQDFGNENQNPGLLKRTRSANNNGLLVAGLGLDRVERRKSVENRYPELPNENEFNDALIEAVLGPEIEKSGTVGTGEKIGTVGKAGQSSPALPDGKRLRVFQDISVNSMN